MADDQAVLFDVNALVALCLTSHQHHRVAHRFLARVERWLTCPVTEAALYRLLLNPAITGARHDITTVDAVVRGLRTDPRWGFLDDATTLADPAIDIRVLMGHQQVTDLHLVNLAARSASVLATFDAALPASLAPADRAHVLVIPQT